MLKDSNTNARKYSATHLESNYIHNPMKSSKDNIISLYGELITHSFSYRDSYFTILVTRNQCHFSFHRIGPVSKFTPACVFFLFAHYSYDQQVILCFHFRGCWRLSLCASRTPKSSDRLTYTLSFVQVRNICTHLLTHVWAYVMANKRVTFKLVSFFDEILVTRRR